MPTNDANYITVIKSNCTREGETQKIAFAIFRHRNDDINFFSICHINLMLIRAINIYAFTTVTFDIKDYSGTVIKMYFTIETRHELFPRSYLPLTTQFPD